MEINGIVYQKVQISGTDNYWLVSKCKSNDTSLSIEHEIDGVIVKGISPYAFLRCVELVHLNIPDTIEYIGERAFDGCVSLRTIFVQVSKTINKQDTLSLYEACFHNCSELISIIGDKIIKFQESAVFENCEKLQHFGFNNKITGDLKTATFNGCVSLESIHMVDNCCHLQSNCLLNCNKLTTIRFDAKKVTMAKSALSLLTQKHIICSKDCNLVDLAYDGTTIITT